MDKRPTHADQINALIKARSNKMTFGWLPVRRKADDQTPLGITLGRALTEELFFFPSKVVTLLGVFAVKDATNPGFFTWFYMTMVKLIFILPWIIGQSILWQGWRALKALCGVCTGTITYRSQDKTKNK